ncbi:hypothetical protein [Bradyrhizobium niftali]|uniref:Class I SAM-dependent methyltransferase n=1 Tax=Bradyrhizobium niftali TaxID=2560055 RepID=A0A4Y9LL21_9BRAD|nr:hypothetical protein [Bradyrhizobium niftali]TFV44270.1 hypothetical protein E4K65_28660 [Bradyrhizobium niftali]
MTDIASSLSAAKFIARKYIRGYSISSTFDTEEGLSAFSKAVQSSKCYLEYGSGSSTVLAAKFAQRIVSVESDAVFCRAVRKMLPERAGISLIHVDIGLTRQWGYPVFSRPTERRIRRWQKYPQAPWQSYDFSPDLLLIDGRFRVACALESLLHIGEETKILIDDYPGRPYEIIEEFADRTALYGTMAEFRKKKSFDSARCRAQLGLYYADYR